MTLAQTDTQSGMAATHCATRGNDEPRKPQAKNSAAPQVTARQCARALLTARELEVLGLIAQGHSNKLIAHALELSPHTVKRHVANVLAKLALESRGQAAAWYYAQAAGRST